ncbi:type II secretion system F family protein, partial [bacterium]|nr:type II secretion system F family protein [bacterium]
MKLFSLTYRKQPGLQDIIQVLHSLSALLEARFPVPDALKECNTQTSNIELQKSLQRMHEMLIAGEPLSSAFASETNFPQLVPALVRTSEKTGTLHIALEHAAGILELRYEGHQNLISALAYPAIIMIVTFFSALFLAIVIAPQTADMYQRMGHELPLLTQSVIYGGYFALATMVFLVLVAVIIGSTSGIDAFMAGLTKQICRISLFRSVLETHNTA